MLDFILSHCACHR
jgi:hypothetical protein